MQDLQTQGPPTPAQQDSVTSRGMEEDVWDAFGSQRHQQGMGQSVPLIDLTEAAQSPALAQGADAPASCLPGRITCQLKPALADTHQDPVQGSSAVSKPDAQTRKRSVRLPRPCVWSGHVVHV